MRKDLCTGETVTVESCFIEVENCSGGNIIMYKPPDVPCVTFTRACNDILKLVNNENKKCYIMGDFNINLLKRDTENSVQLFLDMLNTYSFYPLIDKPTRITGESATLIDTIFTNDFSSHRAGILITDISDHLPIFMAIDKCKAKV